MEQKINVVVDFTTEAKDFIRSLFSGVAPSAAPGAAPGAAPSTKDLPKQLLTAVRQIITELLAAGKQAKLEALFKKAGIKVVTDLPAEDLVDFLDALKTL